MKVLIKSAKQQTVCDLKFIDDAQAYTPLVMGLFASVEEIADIFAGLAAVAEEGRDAFIDKFSIDHCFPPESEGGR